MSPVSPICISYCINCDYYYYYYYYYYYSDLNYVFEWLKRGWMPNGLAFKYHSNTVQPNLWNTGQMDAILFSYVVVKSLKGWAMAMSVAMIPSI